MRRWSPRLLLRMGGALGAVGLGLVAMTIWADSFRTGASGRPPPWRPESLAEESGLALLAEPRARSAWATDEVEEYRQSFEWQSVCFEFGALARFGYDPYLPIESDPVWNFAATSLLARAREPRFRRGLLFPPGHFALRVIVSPTFQDALVLRVESSPDGLSLGAARLPGEGRLNYSMHRREMVWETKQRALSASACRQLRQLIAQVDALRAPDDFPPELKDGAVWTFEFAYRGRYHAFHVHEPTYRAEERGLVELAELGRFLLRESDLQELPQNLLPKDR